MSRVTEQVGEEDLGPKTLNLESVPLCTSLTSYIAQRVVCLSFILWVASRLGRGEKEMGASKMGGILNEAWGQGGKGVQICHAE